MPEQELSIAPAAQSPCYIPPSTAVGLDYFSIGTLLQAGYAFVVGPLGFAKQCCAPHWFSCAAMVLQPFRFFVWSSQVFSTDVFFPCLYDCKVLHALCWCTFAFGNAVALNNRKGMAGMRT